MVPTSKRLRVCILWCVLGAGRFALANRSGDVHAAEESVKTSPVILDIDPRSDRVIAAAVPEPSKRQRSDLSDDSALELAERKEPNRVAPSGSRGTQLYIKIEFEEMLDALKIPVQDRVFHLHGLSLFTSIISNPNIKNVVHAYGALKQPCSDSLKPAAAQISSDILATEGQDRRSRRSPWSAKSEGTSTSRRSNRFSLDACCRCSTESTHSSFISAPVILEGNLRGPTIMRSSTREHSLTAVPSQPSHSGTSSSSPRLDALWFDRNIEREKDVTGMKSKDDDDSLFELDIARVFPKEHLPSTRPWASSCHDEASPSSPTDLQTNPGGRATQVGETEVPSGEPRRELYGDPLVIIKDIIQDHRNDGRMEIWNSLQQRLLDFEIWSSLWIPLIPQDEAVFRLGFCNPSFC
ncbi:hypothetical protein KEM48_009171 [Puccinia striiformis f. sp. tritici PST-130]|nr:hypothetical protein KEM48_009171 [Puccinia striiformis f. sp. tritici PST-130]